jgi:hypothetical protein
VEAIRPVNRAALEHLIRASAAIAGDSHVVVVGSQSILGRYPDAPAELLVSMEADVYPKHDPENAIVIDGAIGERSMFHDTFGYYAHGVGPDTAVLPEGWQARTIAICNANTNGFIGECLEPHDLVVSKLAAGREKDGEFVQALLVHSLVDLAVVQERIGQVKTHDAAYRELLIHRLHRISRRMTRPAAES